MQHEDVVVFFPVPPTAVQGEPVALLAQSREVVGRRVLVLVELRASGYRSVGERLVKGERVVGSGVVSDEIQSGFALPAAR